MRIASHVVLFSLVLGFADVPERTNPKPAPPQDKAEDVSGAYSFRGVEKGEAYQGMLMVIGAPPAYRVIWMTDEGETFRGTALQDGDVLAVGWSVVAGVHPAQGPVLKQGVNVYRRDGEGWRGRWTTGERVSVEAWRRMDK